MTVTSCIDKETIVHLLDMRTQCSLYIFFWILGYLLELVNGEDAGFFSLLKVTKNLLQGQLWCMYVTQLDVKGWESCYGVVAETSCKRMYSLQEFINHSLSFRH